MGGSEVAAAEHLLSHPDGLAEIEGRGAVEQVEGWTRAEGDAYEAELRAKYEWEAICAAKPAPLLVEAAEDDLAALLSASLRSTFELTGSNLYELATHLLDGGIRTVEHFEALRVDYVHGLGFSASDEGKIAAAKEAKAAEARVKPAEEQPALTPAQEKMLEEAYDRKDGGVRFQMLWHRVRNQAGAPTNAQAKEWLAQAPDNPPAGIREPEPAGKMVMRNGKYVVVKPGEKKPKPKAEPDPEPAPEREPDPEPEGEREPEPEPEQPAEVDPEDDPNLSEQEKKALRRAKQKADRERLKAERAAAEALLAKEEGGDDALYAGIDEPAVAPAPHKPAEKAPASAPEEAPAEAQKAPPKPELSAAPAPAPAGSPEPEPAATTAPASAVVPEGVPPSPTENVGILSSTERGGKTFYNIRWTDATGTVHETSRRYSQFDELRKKLIKLVGPEIKTLPFPKKKLLGNKARGVVDSRQGELAAFLVDLIVVKKLVQPKDTGDASAASVLYDFLHGEETL